MPLIFSPVTHEELTTNFSGYPRSAFLMLQSGGDVSGEDAYIVERVRNKSQNLNINIITAVDIAGTKDYLTKIVDLIQGCGSGIAVFSSNTPKKTIGNIFFEIGLCLTLGKPVQLIANGRDCVPSDFVRTETIFFSNADRSGFNRQIDIYLNKLIEVGEYYKTLGDLAYDAIQPDLELAFERYKQAVLISGDQEALENIMGIRDKLSEIRRNPEEHQNIHFQSHQERLYIRIRDFLVFLN